MENITIYSHHARRTGINTLITGLTGKNYTEIKHEMEKTKKNKKRLKGVQDRWYRKHRYISKESKELINKTRYVYLEEPGGWGGEYSLILIDKCGELYKARLDSKYSSRILNEFRLAGSSRLGLLNYDKVGKLASLEQIDINDFRYKTSVVGFDYPSNKLFKRVKNIYKLVYETGDLTIEVRDGKKADKFRNLMLAIQKELE